MDEKLKNEWLNALVKLYEKQLMLDKNIMSGTKREKVENYLEVLEQARQEVVKSGSVELENLFKNFYFDLYVIKEENIPYSVYEAKQRIAREQGYGTIPITEEYKKQKNNQIIEDQKISLNKWLDYFLYDEEAKIYKPWEIYWVLEGLQKLGKFDKEKQTFSKRDKNTIYPFPEVDKAAIFNTLNLMEEYIKSKKGPEELKNALSQSNFKQLYEYSLKKLYFSDKEKDNETKGIWKKYNQGSDYHIMRNDLQGKMTGWCIEAGEREYLDEGDFYIYYTMDKEGNYTNPRIAIRTEGPTEIAEIRGILNDQNMEPEMLPILDDKLKEFSDKDKYYKRVHDMEYLTLIEKKINTGIELNVEELAFLYEINDKIEGFGEGIDCEKDPRIEELKNKRNIKADLSLIFNCNENEIAFEKEEINEYTKIFGKHLDLRDLKTAEGLNLPKIILGDIDLRGLKSAKGLKLPERVVGNLYLNGLTSDEYLILPKIILGDLNLSGLKSAKELKFPKIISGELDLKSLTSAEGLKLPNSVKSLHLNSLKSVEGLKLPDTIEELLNLESLTSAEGLKLPKGVLYLHLNSLKSVGDLKLPEHLGGHLYLSSLTSTKGLNLPEIIAGYLDLGSLTNAEGLKLPKIVGYDLDLSSLTSDEGLKLPEKVGGTLDLSSLTSAEVLKLPQSIGETESLGGYLDLSSLTNAEGLILPQSIDTDYYLMLNSLTSAEGLVFPEELTYKICLANNIVITPENVDKFRTNKKL